MKECEVDESDDDEEQIDKDLRLLSPTSSWSVMVDIKAIARLSKKSCLCGHNLQLLNFNKTRISFTCISCHEDDLFDICSDTNGAIMEDSINVDSSFEHDLGKDGGETSNKPIEDKKTEDDINNSDEEIDKLLMDSPVKGNNFVDTSEENPPVSAMPSTEDNMKDVEPEQSKPSSSSQSRPLTPGLRLKPFRDLQPLVPGLPQYTSRKMEDGVNPMENIPHYEEDDSLVEESLNVMPPISFNSVPTPTSGNATYKVIKVGNIDQAKLVSVPGNVATALNQTQMYPNQFQQMQQRQTPSPTHQGHPRQQMRTRMMTTPPTSRVRARMSSQFRPGAPATVTAGRSSVRSPLPYSLPIGTNMIYNTPGGQPQTSSPQLSMAGFHSTSVNHQNVYNLNRINNHVNTRTPGVLISQFSKPEVNYYSFRSYILTNNDLFLSCPCIMIQGCLQDGEELSRRLQMELVLSLSPLLMGDSSRIKRK